MQLLAAMGLLVCAGPLRAAETTAAPAEQTRAREMLDATGVPAGLVVHLGCGDGKLTAALRAGDGYLVHGLDTDAANVEAARKHVESLGLCGKVLVERWAGNRLPHVDNLVNLLISEDLGKLPMDEVMRVLTPGGVAFLKRDGKWAKAVKRWPDDVDQWTHYLYDAGGNAVAHDALVGPPRHVQWKAGPTFARHHDVLASVSAVVATGGRIFYIIDEGPTSLMHYPARWRLAARDAFNGMLLWKRPIPTWENYLRPFRSGPPQLPRRLVAVGDRVYVTLGLDAPVSALDAATGKTLKTYHATAGTDEILHHQGLLLLVTFDAEGQPTDAAAARRGSPPAGSPRSVMAVDARSGDVLWRKTGAETARLHPSTLAAGGDRVAFQCGEEVRCVDLKTGSPRWRYARAKASRAPGKRPGKKPSWPAGYYAPTLVVCPDHAVVLSADRGRLSAIALEDGRLLWSCPCKPDFHAPADVFLADRLVWAGLFATEGRDPKTGEVKRTIDIEGLLTAGHHPRCYRNKATDRFVIAGKRGMEFMDLRSGAHSRNNWVRGGCQYGIMPAFGLTFVPPNPCCCYAGAQLHGFYALAAARQRSEVRGQRSERLEKGPAYAEEIHPSSFLLHPSRDWPTFRGDATRSGSTGTPVPTSPAKTWETTVGGKLSAPVVGDGMLLVASVEQGRVVALDAESGKPIWSFAAAGRVDTPPTIHRRLVLFGAADGWVYCLRAADGRLVWRFRAAAEDRRVVVDGRLESVWPVHGNVLVRDDVAYVAAGRSCYLDGGIHLYGLRPPTGEKLYEARVVVPPSKDESLAFIMAGVRPDVLVSDGKYIYLQQLKFDKRLVRQKGLGRHVLCHSGLADDAWFYRTFWRLGYGDEYDFPNSYIKHDLRVPFGQLLVFDGEVVCGLQTFFSPGISPSIADDSGRGCMLFGDANSPFTPDEVGTADADYPRKVARPKQPTEHAWTARLPFQARAMVLAGKTLFVAGWPDVVDADDPSAAPQGRKGGVLWAFSAEDGKKLAACKLHSPPVFDGLIAAGGRLYVSSSNGHVLCMGGDN